MRKRSIGLIISIFLIPGSVLLPRPLAAQTAETADRTGLESVWKKSGRTTGVIDYPFSPQPGIYGGKTVREWGNRGYIFVNPRAEEFTRRRPRRTVELGEIPVEAEDCREIREELLEEVARSEELRQERDRLAQEAAALRETAADRGLKIEALEFQIEELERAAAAAAPGISTVSPDRPAGPGEAAPAATATYFVREGDSLWKIAGRAEVYNDPYRWLLLYHANRDQIFLPDLIYPGMVLLVPRYPELEEAVSPGREVEPTPEEEPGTPEPAPDSAEEPGTPEPVPDSEEEPGTPEPVPVFEEE